MSNWKCQVCGRVKPDDGVVKLLDPRYAYGYCVSCNAKRTFFRHEEPVPEPAPQRVSAETRRGRVLALLRSKPGQWFTGPEIANAEVGGSEGLKRLRELRASGFAIEKKKHPHRAVWQYRLVE